MAASVYILAAKAIAPFRTTIANNDKIAKQQLLLVEFLAGVSKILSCEENRYALALDCGGAGAGAVGGVKARRPCQVFKYTFIYLTDITLTDYYILLNAVKVNK